MGIRKKKTSQEWLEWLADEPASAVAREQIRNRRIAQAGSQRVVPRSVPNTSSQQSGKEQPNSPATAITINIGLPKLRKPIFPKIIKSNAKPIIYTGGGLVITGVLVGSLVLFRKNTISSTDTSDSTGVLSEKNAKPEFAYTVPDGEEKRIDGAVRYDAEKKVVNYKDSIGGVPIVISQQPLPTGFKEGTQDKVKKLAEEFAATEELVTANPTAYLGTSAKGPQTVIFAKNNLLIFIQSTKEIDKADWAQYITALKLK